MDALQWIDGISHDVGIITGCDAKHEWLLPWWYANVSQYNKLPITFANFGLSSHGMDWCKTRGSIVNLTFKARRNWFKKPVAILNASYKNIIWLDTDCEVLADLTPLIEYSNKVGLVADPYNPHIRSKWSLQTGAVVCSHNNKLILDWATECIHGGHRQRGDQEVLNNIVINDDIYTNDIEIMPPNYHRLRLDKDHSDALMIHWTGSMGKAIIRGKMAQAKMPRLGGSIRPITQLGQTGTTFKRLATKSRVRQNRDKPISIANVVRRPKSKTRVTIKRRYRGK